MSENYSVVRDTLIYISVKVSIFSTYKRRKKKYLQLSLQDFTVLPTEIFRRCVITSSSVNYSPTSSPTE
jgi:hypothetical protein